MNNWVSRNMIPRIVRLNLLVTIMLVLSVPYGWPQSTSTDGACTAQTGEPPRFEDFGVSSVFRGKPAPVDLSGNPKARTFRTKLTEGAKEGPNFAGHYTAVSWHCGTECQAVAVIDAKTGQVYFAPFSTSEDSEFRVNSMLFIANSPEKIKRRKQDPQQALNGAAIQTTISGKMITLCWYIPSKEPANRILTLQTLYCTLSDGNLKLRLWRS